MQGACARATACACPPGRYPLEQAASAFKVLLDRRCGRAPPARMLFRITCLPAADLCAPASLASCLACSLLQCRLVARRALRRTRLGQTAWLCVRAGLGLLTLTCPNPMLCGTWRRPAPGARAQRGGQGAAAAVAAARRAPVSAGACRCSLGAARQSCRVRAGASSTVRGSWSPAHANLHVLSAAPLGCVLLLRTQRREWRLTLWHSLSFWCGSVPDMLAVPTDPCVLVSGRVLMWA